MELTSRHRGHNGLIVKYPETSESVLGYKEGVGEATNLYASCGCREAILSRPSGREGLNPVVVIPRYI